MTDGRVELIATLRYDECDEGCAQPCKLHQQTRDKAADLLSRDGARIAELEAENARLQDKAIRFDLDAAGIETREREAVELVELKADNARLRAALAEAQREAERYRWLRENRLHTSGLPAICIISFDGYHIHIARDEADKHIDAAIEKERSHAKN